jgi:exonuclease III
MAFRKKAMHLAPFNADILVIPECEHPDKLTFESSVIKPADIQWFGTNNHKGLGIFSFGGYKLTLIEPYNPDLRTIIPLVISNGRKKFFMLAIWANNPDDKDGQYVEQVWKALHHYDALFKKQNVLLVGDFNSNTIWDKQHRRGNHSDVVQYLGKKNIQSCYHKHHSQEHGTEEHPTFYLYRHQDKPYHIDYCFASKKVLSHLTDVQVGDYNSWKKYSDHVPVITTFKF